MKKCNACGSSVDDSVMNCPNCGSNNFAVAQQVTQPVMNQQMPMGQIPQQPMPQMPMMQAQPMPTGNMPMTYATVYMVFIGLGAVGNFFSLFKEFSFSTLIAVIFAVAMVYFLYKRSKVGRILAMIESVLSAVVGGIFVLLGILFAVGFTAIDLGAEFAVVGGLLGGLLLIFGIVMLIIGICSFIYFKKRACMYVN